MSGDGLRRLGDRTLARTDLGLIEEAAKYDRWGRTYPETVFEGSPITDALFRMFSPTKVTKYRPHPGDILIATWNRMKPVEEKDVEIAPLSTSYEVNGRTRYWSDKQYGELCRLTGEISAELYRNCNYDPEHPTAEQVDALKDGFSEAASAARAYLKKYSEDRYASPLDVSKVARVIRVEMLEQARKKLDSEFKGRRLGEKSEDFEERKADWKRGREQARERLQREKRGLGWKPKPGVD